MGVSGLWGIINQAAVSRSLAHFAVVDGFDNNGNKTRSLRIGIDASLWLRHTDRNEKNKLQDRGPNWEIRTLFERICKLSRLPFTLLFVFDGRFRPKLKRGSRVGKSGSHPRAKYLKELLDIFGIDWREAKGEAEVELAYLNAKGYVDAILSDDVDTLIFGAHTVLKNVSRELTGNKSNPARDANGNVKGTHATIVTAQAIKDHPNVSLDRAGLILIALCAGGDYDKGIKGLGTTIAHALARLGYGERLLRAYQSLSPAAFKAWLPRWRADMTHDMHTGARGLLASRYPSRSIPHDFPPLETLEMYVRPAIHEGDHGGPVKDRGAIDLKALAGFCERMFTDWNGREAILKKFRNLVYPGVVMLVLRTAAVEADRREENRRIAAGQRPNEVQLREWKPAAGEAIGTPEGLVRKCIAPPGKRKRDKDAQMESIRSAFVNKGPPVSEERLDVAGLGTGGSLVVGVVGKREHVSTDRLLELRVEVCIEQIVPIVASGLGGRHAEPRGSKRKGKAKENEKVMPGHPKGRGIGFNKLYEDTESEDEAGGTQNPESEEHPIEISEAELDDEPDDGETREGIMRLWIPATILRRVDPELVTEFEEGRILRREGAQVPAPAPRIPVVATVPTKEPEVVSHIDVPPRHISIEVGDAPRANPRKPRTSTSARSKGKARAMPHDDLDDILRMNPDASTAPPRDELDVFAESSLPLRNCGFVFTWPDPCDPDELIVDTADRDDIETQVDYVEVEGAGGGVYRELEEPEARDRAVAVPSSGLGAAHGDSRKTRAKPKPRPRAKTKAKRTAVFNARDDSSQVARKPMPGKRKRASLPAQGAVAEDDDEDEDIGAPPETELEWGMFSDYREDQRRARQSTPSRSMQKTSGTVASSSSSTNTNPKGHVIDSPLKRRKMWHEIEPGVFDEIDEFDIRDSSEEPELPWKKSPRFSLPSDNPPLDRSPSPVYIPHSSPAPGPPSSSPRPSTPVAARRRSVVDAVEVISISSDSGEDEMSGITGTDSPGEWWKKPPFNGQPSLYSQRKGKAASSQGAFSDPAARAEDSGLGVAGAKAGPLRVASNVRRVGLGGPSSARCYRDFSMPSSSQDSMLGDLENDDAF
ncbi:hypothetical protein C8Q79DRAFT_971273 [Trametes meyenii]|nr:hypothetical protein C8Q79DRAFT_971273 [Trametes meyenii]